jgi:arylsulfatase A-like enzyme
MWDHWNVPICSYDRTGRYDNVIPFISHFQQSNVATSVHCDRIVPGRHSSELLTDTAIAFLEQADAGQPFFLYTAYLAPHDPRSMPARYRALYDPQQLTLPDNVLPDHPFDFGVAGIRDEVLTARPRDEQTTRCQLADYYAMISHLDHEIGRILDTLERQGRLEQTIIVLAGDNGLAVGCHGLMGKQNLYEHSVRVPLLLAGPGIPADVRCTALVYLLDLYPTLFELLGLPIPPSVEGQSFAATLADPALPQRQRLYLAYADLIRAVKDERFKLIEYRGVARQTQLFDLVKDPAECRSLADDPRYQVVRDHLRAALLEMARDWDDAQHPMGQRFWRAYHQAAPDSVTVRA